MTVIDHDTSPDALVPWWSFTKTVLGSAALRLVAAGRLHLDDPIAERLYTLRHLLQHTAGLPEYGSLAAYHAAVAGGETPWPDDELLRRVDVSTLRFSPGTSWSYSNVGYLLVRRIIERTVDSELNAALRTLVLGPVGAHRTFVATCADDLLHTIGGSARRYDPRWVYHGLLVGPLAEAVLVLDRLMYGDLLPNHLKAEMLTGVSVGGPFDGRPAVAPSYGLGTMIDAGGSLGRTVGHTGQGPGSTIAVYSFPDLPVPCTLGAFAAADGENAPGTLERHVLSRAARRQSGP